VSLPAVDEARCPQCRQVLVPSDWSEEAGEPVFQCQTVSCPTAGAGGCSLVLFQIVEHYQPARSEDPCDSIAEEAIPYATVDVDGIVTSIADAEAEAAAFRAAFPQLHRP